MSLSAGSRLGPYEIVSNLGAGGMGEVYRARDTRLDRTVAIKVLKSTLEISPELKQRFEREARTISQLNHPHICTLYDVGHQDGTDFLVMEYLEGETLAERLNKGALPFREVLKIAIDVLDGLEQAHRAGIVHRDLKPGNVMLTKTGAKLLDFGLAKPALANAAASAASAPLLSAVMTVSSPASPLTTAGALLGTVQYMAPEQFEGKEADARSDIFACGAILYEMASGKRPFAGKSQIKIASSILEDDPQSISELQPGLPPSFEHVVRTCLHKSPDERYQSAHDIAVELKWLAGSAQETAQPTRTGAPRVWIAAAMALGLLLGVGVIGLLRPERAAPPIALGILPTAGVTFNFSGLFGPPAFSPDGTRLAMVGTDSTGERMLYLRSLGHTTVQSIQGTKGASYPFWSPDGQKIGFFTSDALKVADIAGGSVLLIASNPEGRGGTWNERGDIVFGTRTTGLMRLSASGGTPVPLTKLTTKQSSHRFPTFFPDGEHVSFVVQGANTAQANVVSLSKPEPVPLTGVMSNVGFSGDRIFHVREDGTLVAQRFDAGRLSLDPNSEVVAKPVGYDGQFTYAAFSVSAKGAIAYEEGSASTANEVVWFDRSGKVLGTLPDALDAYGLGLRISPHSDRLLYGLSNAKRGDIWVVQLARGTRTRITLGAEGGAVGVWSPDGTQVAYENRIGGGSVAVRSSDGRGTERVVVNLQGEVLPSGWSADGKYIVFEYINSPVPNNPREIWVAAVDGSEAPHVLVSHVTTFGSDLSPDGKWLAYTSDESGRPEVYVIPFDPHATVGNALAAGRWQISAEGGHQPRWSPSGKELFYTNISLTTLYAAAVQASGGKLERGEIAKLFDLAPHPPWSFYDINRDGQIYMFRYVGRQSSPLTVLLNWQPAKK